MSNSIKTTNNLTMANLRDDTPRNQYAHPVTQAARVGRGALALWGGLLVAVLVAAFVSLGLWQWRKAETKTRLQAELDERSQGALIAMAATPVEGDLLRFRHVVVQGEYDGPHQILIDNRLHQEQAGYHVLTPLRLAGSDMHVLVNRGWVPAAADHRVLPVAPVPTGTVQVTGVAVVPSDRFFTLGDPTATGAEAVWQNLDLERFRKGVPYPVQPLVVQLDAAASGGYVRDWPRPDERADRHRSYALQWFGFAASSIVIWAFLLLRRP